MIVRWKAAELRDSIKDLAEREFLFDRSSSSSVLQQLSTVLRSQRHYFRYKSLLRCRI
jgi:hypothetical protein